MFLDIGKVSELGWVMCCLACLVVFFSLLKAGLPNFSTLKKIWGGVGRGGPSKFCKVVRYNVVVDT